MLNTLRFSNNTAVFAGICPNAFIFWNESLQVSSLDREAMNEARLNSARKTHTLVCAATFQPVVPGFHAPWPWLRAAQLPLCEKSWKLLQRLERHMLGLNRLKKIVKPGGSEQGERANFARLVLGCIEASKQARKFVPSHPWKKKRDPGKPRATKCTWPDSTGTVITVRPRMTYRFG